MNFIRHHTVTSLNSLSHNFPMVVGFEMRPSAKAIASNIVF